MRTFIFKTVAALVFSLTSLVCFADGIAVVANPAVGVDALSSDEVMRLFLGKVKAFANDQTVTPLAQKEGSDIRTAFGSKVLQKTPVQEKAYWSQLIFTGRGVPPDEYGSDAEIKKLVAANPGAIGYISTGSVDSTVKVLFTVAP